MRTPAVFPNPLIIRFMAAADALCPSRADHYTARVVVAEGVTLADIAERPEQWTRGERRAIRRLYRPRVMAAHVR